MRQGITGLVAGFVVGAVLAGSAAFAVSTVSPITAGPASASRDSVRVASQVASHSVDPTATGHASTEATATHHPSVAGTQTPAAHRERERSATQDADHATEAPHRTPATVPTPRATDGSQNHAPDGTVCAPVTVPVADPVVVPAPAPNLVPCTPPATPGERAHHEGSGHE